jgi:hypothetical protein
MRRRLFRALAAALVLGLGSTVLAQFPRFTSSPASDRGDLFQNISVQKELNLDPIQKDRIRKIAQTFEKEHKEEISKARESKDLLKFLEVRQVFLETLGKGLTEVLKPDQLARLEQIQLQVQAVKALTRPEVQKKLKVTDTQKEELRTLASGLERDTRFTIIMGVRDPNARADALKKIQDLTKEATGKAFGVLTEAQKKTWREMTGEPFELKVDLPTFGAQPEPSKDK